MIYVGIDNGKDGAVVALDRNGEILRKYKTPLIKASVRAGKRQGRDEYDLTAMRDVLLAIQTEVKESDGPVMITIEKAQPLPPRMGGSAANFQRGLSFGLWQGLLVGLGISYQVVTPQAWQKAMLAGIAASDTKQAAAIAAQRLWPGIDWRRSDQAKKPDEGLVDAALIAEYGRRCLSGKGLELS